MGKMVTLHHEQFMELTEAARGGDRSALGQLLNGFRSYLNLFADRQLGEDLKQKCSGSDLVQQTFLDAQQAFPRFKGSGPDDLRLWLERILLNNLADQARRYRASEKRRLRREVPLGENWAAIEKLVDRSTPSKKVVANEERERLRRALSRLPEDYREVINLRNLERQSFEDIGLAMGRSTGAVKKLWSRAILKLKEEMKQRGSP